MLILISVILALVVIAMFVGVWLSCDVFADALSRKLWDSDAPPSPD